MGIIDISHFAIIFYCGKSFNIIGTPRKKSNFDTNQMFVSKLIDFSLTCETSITVYYLLLHTLI